MMVKRWVPFAAAAFVLVAAASAGLVARQRGSASTAGPGASTTAGPSQASTTATTATPAAPVAKVPLDRTLVSGESGDDVKRLQQRLADMAFDPGPIDGDFGPATQAAVWAYQKLVVGRTGRDVTGKVTAELWDRMQEPTNIRSLRPNASVTHLEIYLPSQTAVVFVDGAPKLITHISTGTGQKWCEKGYCSTAITPGGAYQFGRRVDGWDDSVLGQLYNPVYFNYGIAVHGAYNVPLYPASHSCVRIPMHIAKYFPNLVKRGEDVFVFDGRKDPEAYGAQPPPFNSKDPNATTTTQATTTTTTTPKSTTSGANSTTTTAATTTTVAPTTTPTTAATTTPPTTPAPTTPTTAATTPASPTSSP